MVFSRRFLSLSNYSYSLVGVVERSSKNGIAAFASFCSNRYYSSSSGSGTSSHSSNGFKNTGSSSSRAAAAIGANVIDGNLVNNRIDIFTFFDRLVGSATFSSSEAAATTVPSSTGGILQQRAAWKLDSGCAGYRSKMSQPLQEIYRSQYTHSFSFGEDAGFVRNNAIGVADGVGFWRTIKDGNPALFSRLLMNYASQYCSSEYKLTEPKLILEKSFGSLLENYGTIAIGAATACVGMMDDKVFRIASLGDCGWMWIREGELLMRSDDQMHGFNHPFQLSIGKTDHANDAKSAVLPVQAQDILLFGTDGLFDNLSDVAIMNIVLDAQVRSFRSGTTVDANQLAKQLLRTAEEAIIDTRYQSPFQTKAIQAGVLHEGGKDDDITIVVSVVQEND